MINNHSACVSMALRGPGTGLGWIFSGEGSWEGSAANFHLGLPTAYPRLAPARPHSLLADAGSPITRALSKPLAPIVS